jgi:Protein of unknown function (DUF2865)
LRRIGPNPLFAGVLLTAFAAVGGAAIPAAGKTGQQIVPMASVLESSIASKLHQLASLKRDIDNAGCEFAADDDSIEACRQLDVRARSLEAEIDELKSQAHSTWMTGKDKAEESLAPQHASPRPKPYTYRWQTNPAATYRTLCVRLCDGYYFPINDRSQPGNFLADAKMCQSSCAVPARLFYQPAPADDATSLLALTGERYPDLPNAFRYRNEYVESCACGPEPWSDEAKAVYDRRAVLATRTEVERIVAAGTGETAKILAETALKLAQRPSRARNAVVLKDEQDRAGQGLFARFRALFLRAQLAGPTSQASNEPRERSFFLFRSRN